MIKQISLLLLLTFAAIVFRTELSHVLNAMVMIHNWVASHLHAIFSDDHLGRIIQNMISLLIIPCLAGLVIALVFLFMKRSAMPHTMAVVWVLWLVLLVTMVAQTGGSRQYSVKKTPGSSVSN